MPVEEQHAADLAPGNQWHGQHRAQLQQLDDLESEALIVAGMADRHRRPGARRQGDVRQIDVREPHAQHIGVIAMGVASHPDAVLVDGERGGLGLQRLGALDDGAPQNLVDLQGRADLEVDAGQRSVQECRLADLLGTALDLIDVDQGHNRTADGVAGGPIRTDAQRIPTAPTVLRVSGQRRQRVDDLLDESVEVGHVERQIEVGERATKRVRRNHEDVAHRRGEPPYLQVATDHDDGNIGACEQVREVVGERAQLDIAAAELLVDRDQLLVCRLQLFLGGLEFFVYGLQFLVGRLDLLIGGTQLLVARLLVFDHRLQVVACRGELALCRGGL